MERTEAREIEQALDFLKETGIELRGAEGGYDVFVQYRETAEGLVETRAVAKVLRHGEGWDINVAAAPLFWGPDWEQHPDLIGCDSEDGVLQFLYEALGPRLDLRGVLMAWMPRGEWQ